MNDMIGSVEFGDWLIAELEDVAILCASEDAAVSRSAIVRRDLLDIAKKLLLEFLTLQHAMFEKANSARNSW